jgi:hypothetical protein
MDTPHTFVVKVFTGPRIIQVFQPSDGQKGEMFSLTYDELWEGTLNIGDLIKARVENKPQQLEPQTIITA